MNPKARKCSDKTKTGKKCKAFALHDTDPPRCLAHADEDTRRSVRFGGPQPGSGVPRKPRPSDVARRLIEDNIAAVLRPYWLALGYEVEAGENGLRLVSVDGGGAKLHTTGSGRVRVSQHDDLEAMQRAAERLQDRVYGRPRQAVHVGPVDAEDRAPEDLDGMLVAQTRQAFIDAGMPDDEADAVLPALPT